VEIVWDAAVIGAGPAGGVAAAMLAGRGWRVLLIEKSSWPREKVCGGCLNADAVGLLAEGGLISAIARAQRIDWVFWHVGGQSLSLPAPGGAAILRSEFDAAMVAIAMERGCEFRPGCSATLLPAEGENFRTLKLRSGSENLNIRARVVLACDGIGGMSLAAERWAGWRVARKAWIGASTAGLNWPAGIESGAIHMHVGNGGYVGLVRLRGGEIVHLAAALDPAKCRKSGGPGPLIAKILESNGLGTPAGLATARFRGSGALTRRRVALGGHRVLAVGDACGYVEPFTGEGMAWAMEAARQAVELLPPPHAPWPVNLADAWKARHDLAIGRRQRFCRALRPMMHHPSIAAIGVAALRAAPVIGNWVAGRVSRAWLAGSFDGSIG